MNNANRPLLLVLDSGIFPDAGTVSQAVELMEGYRVQHEQLNAAVMSSGDWDRVLERVLDSEKTVTL